MRPRGGGPRTELLLYFPQLLLLLAVALGVFTAAFGIWTATSVWSFPQFVLAVAALIYFPGKLLLDITRLRLQPLEDLTLSLVLGMTVSSLVYRFCCVVGLPFAFCMWPLVGVASWLYHRRGRWHEIRRFHVAVSGSHVLLIAAIMLNLIPLSVMPMYYRNLDLLPDESMTYARRPFDFAFHTSFANELRHAISPEVPYLSGIPMTYHYGMDLLVAMLSRMGHIGIPDLTVRFMPTFFLAITVLAVFCFSRVWLRSGYGAVLAAFLVVLGEDFSFIPGLLLNVQGVWSDWFFGVSTTYPLYFFNPMLPALAVLFAALFCLCKLCEGGGKSWLLLTSALFAVLFDYKAFATAHVLLCLAIAGCTYFLLHRDSRLLKVLAVTLLLMIPLLYLHGGIGAQVKLAESVRLEPWPYIPNALEDLGLSQTPLARHVNSLFTKGLVTVPVMVSLFLVALPLYLLGSLGLRILAVPGLLKALRFPQSSSALRFFLACFCIIGPVITLSWTVTPQGYPPASDYNNSVWFFMQSKYVLWLYVVALIVGVCRDRSRAVQLLIVSIVVMLAVPSSIQYFHRQAQRQLLVLGTSELGVVDYLQTACSEGQVILAREEVAEHLVALTPCHTPVLDKGVYLHSFASPSEVARRLADYNDFWGAWRAGDLRIGILERYGVTYLVVDKEVDDLARARYHDAASEETVVEVGSAFIQPCFENEGFIVYKVSYVAA